MRVLNGAVLFVDMLGFGALTQGQIQIAKSDFTSHRFSGDYDDHAHIFSAKLLAKFRSRLTKIKVKNLKIAQLSDCAFIWSEEVDLVVEAARKLMWLNIKGGLLCRAGLSYGEIIEPDLVDIKLGAFICGKAVTEAVKLESVGKGARVFVGNEFSKGLIKIPIHAFSNCIDHSDGRMINEFLWYCYPDVESVEVNDNVYLERRPSSSGLAKVQALIKLLKESEKFMWNRKSTAGKKQLDNTIRVIKDSLGN